MYCKVSRNKISPAFSGAQKRVEMLRHPCILGGPQRQAHGAKSEMAASPLPSRGPKGGEQNQKWSPTKENKIRSGCLIPAFSGAQKRAEMQCHPCILRDPQQRGTKSEVAASPLPSRGPKRGRKCYVTPAFSGISNAKCGEQNQKWSPTKENKIRSGRSTPAFSGAQKRAEMLRHPCIVGGPQTGVQKGPSLG